MNSVKVSRMLIDVEEGPALPAEIARQQRWRICSCPRSHLAEGQQLPHHYRLHTRRAEGLHTEV